MCHIYKLVEEEREKKKKVRNKEFMAHWTAHTG